MRTNEKNMTTGSPGKLIITFAIPLMLGNIFQQFYTMADTSHTSQSPAPTAASASTPTTCEIVITVIDGKVDRVYDEETGHNVFKFANFPFEKEVLKKAGKKDIIATKNIGKTLCDTCHDTEHQPYQPVSGAYCRQCFNPYHLSDDHSGL